MLKIKGALPAPRHAHAAVYHHAHDVRPAYHSYVYHILILTL